MFSGTAHVSHQVCQFFVSSVCLLVRVTVVDKNKAVVWCLLATSALMLSEKKKGKRKMCSKKWFLERNISCDADLLNEFLEGWVPWDDSIVVSAGKLRKVWDSLNELFSSLCERRLERRVPRPSLLPVKTAQFTQFFRQVMSHSKIAQFNWECIRPLRVYRETVWSCKSCSLRHGMHNLFYFYFFFTKRINYTWQWTQTGDSARLGASLILSILSTFDP